MDEKKWMDLIRDSAEDLEVPEGLRPENVEKMLRDVKKGPEKKKGKILTLSRRLGAAAAVVMVLGLTWQAARLSEKNTAELNRPDGAGIVTETEKETGGREQEKGTENLAEDRGAGETGLTEEISTEPVSEQRRAGEENPVKQQTAESGDEREDVGDEKLTEPQQYTEAGDTKKEAITEDRQSTAAGADSAERQDEAAEETAGMVTQAMKADNLSKDAGVTTAQSTEYDLAAAIQTEAGMGETDAAVASGEKDAAATREAASGEKDAAAMQEAAMDEMDSTNIETPAMIEMDSADVPEDASQDETSVVLTADSMDVLENMAANEETLDSDRSEDSAAVNDFAPISDYQELFDALSMWKEETVICYDTGIRGLAATEDGAIMRTSTSAGQQKESAASGAAQEGSMDYSTTNLMELGVDEGDIVKTDGKYLYVMQEQQVRILEISGKKIGETARIELLAGEESDQYEEMYVDGDKLVLIVSGTNTRMIEEEDSSYQMETRPYTAAYTYSISDPKNPSLAGKLKLDGNYHTSRKNGDYLYLLTDYYPMINTKASNSIFIPLANGEEFAEEDILMPRQMESARALVAVSVDLSNPGTIKDRKSLVGISDLIYVSQESIYVTQTQWNTGDQLTNIMKFSYKDGKLEAEGAGAVPGYLNDGFSMNEYQGYLRIVTTDWDGEEKNGLYVLDESMHTVGRITDLAPGEQIYSARFLGDMGYFVTFRNTDPLFSVDLSRPEEPRIIGELKITGFSEYLHFWGEDKLLGIGKEADPDTGEVTGVKLSMFDISDPENVTEESKYVLGGRSQSIPGVEQYKAILADPEKNLIGLAIGDTYQVFSYSGDAGFTKRFQTSLTGSSWEARGVYVKNWFYLVDDGDVTAYDMDEEFGK